MDHWTEVADLHSRGSKEELVIQQFIAGGRTCQLPQKNFLSPPTAAILTEGDLFLSGGTTLKGFGKAAGIPGTWASGGI